MNVAKNYIDSISTAITLIDMDLVNKLVDLLETTYFQTRTVFIAGNGGSASNASHFSQALSNVLIPASCKFLFRAISLNDNIPNITAISNDYGYEHIFTNQLQQLAREKDVFIALSTSGNSVNIINAAQYASLNKIKVIGITGFDGGILKTKSDFHINIPLFDAGKVEIIHDLLFHLVSYLLKIRLKNKKS